MYINMFKARQAAGRAGELSNPAWQVHLYKKQLRNWNCPPDSLDAAEHPRQIENKLFLPFCFMYILHFMGTPMYIINWISPSLLSGITFYSICNGVGLIPTQRKQFFSMDYYHVIIDCWSIGINSGERWREWEWCPDTSFSLCCLQVSLQKLK